MLKNVSVASEELARSDAIPTLLRMGRSGKWPQVAKALALLANNGEIIPCFRFLLLINIFYRPRQGPAYAGTCAVCSYPSTEARNIQKPCS